MKLLTKANRDALPKLYSGEKLGMNATAHVKFFHPGSSWTWYASEFDGTDVFFGLVDGLDCELGYFTLGELEGVKVFGLGIERDLHWSPRPLKDCQGT